MTEKIKINGKWYLLKKEGPKLYLGVTSCISQPAAHMVCDRIMKSLGWKSTGEFVKLESEGAAAIGVEYIIPEGISDPEELVKEAIRND